MKRFFVFAPMGFILLLILAACFAPYLAPYDAEDENRSSPFHPPTRIRFQDGTGAYSLRPFVYETRMTFDENQRRIYEEDSSRKYFISFGVPKLFQVEAPARIYLMGSDSRGRDLFSRILFGARISMSVGLVGALVASVIGLLIGGVSGYYGGRLDEVLMRISEFFIMIPGFYFLLALRSALPPELGSAEVYILIIVILSLIGWGGIARVIRGMVFSIRQNDFVFAAKVLGKSDFYILTRHIFPHTFSYLIVVLSISIPSYVLAESALSVLGLGIQEPDVSWGNLLVEALSVAHIRLHPWVLYPGFFIFLTALSFNMLGDQLKESGRCP